MTVKKFDATPTPSEGLNLDDISKDNVKEAWSGYESKAEYKKFNKQDLIESMQSAHEEDSEKKSEQA